MRIQEALARLLDLLQLAPLAKEHTRQVRELRISIEALLAVQREKRTQRGELLLLWSWADDVDDHRLPRRGPSCAAVGFGVEPGLPRTVHVPVMVPVPAGAWLVARGCVFAGSVCVGNDQQNLSLADAGVTLIQVRDAIPLGVLLRATVQGA